MLKPPLPSTVYRMDEFARLLEEEKWDLPLPLVVRGKSITEESLRASAAVVARTLRLAQPFLRGEDVRAVQAGLNRNGFANIPDGVFGPATDALLRQFQSSRNLSPDGVAGPRTRAALDV